jgi:hypothetical protein
MVLRKIICYILIFVFFKGCDNHYNHNYFSYVFLYKYKLSVED